MKRETPPLDALEAFLQAADALAISPSAFSRRIQALEAFLGMPLFERRGSRPQLSEPGLVYLQTILPAIKTIRPEPISLLRCGLRIASRHRAVGWDAAQHDHLRNRHGN